MQSDDFRQSEAWMIYLEGIGWKWDHFDDFYFAYRKIPLFNSHLFKIQRAQGNVDLQKLDEFARANGALSIILEPHFYDFDQSHYLNHGFRQSKTCYAPSATLIIDLTKNEEELWKGLSENARRNIRFAKKHSIDVQFYSGDDAEERLDGIYAQWKHVSQIRKFYMPSEKEISIKFRALKKNVVFACVYDSSKELLASVWFVVYGNTVTYLHAGNSEKGYESKANFLLVWESILHFKKMGLKLFDFESYIDHRHPKVTNRWKGFSEFKHKFGGEIVYYPYPLIKTYNSFFRVFYSLGDIFS